MMRNLVRRSGSRPFSLERIISNMSPCSFSITTNTFSGVSNMHSRFTIPGCRRLWRGGGAVWGQGPGHPRTWDPRGQAMGSINKRRTSLRGKVFPQAQTEPLSCTRRCPEGSFFPSQNSGQVPGLWTGGRRSVEKWEDSLYVCLLNLCLLPLPRTLARPDPISPTQTDPHPAPSLGSSPTPFQPPSSGSPRDLSKVHT